MTNKKYKIIDGDIDFSTSQRTIKRMDKRRWKKVYGLLRQKLNFSSHCGHEYDCCGCCHRGYFEVNRGVLKNELLITYTEHYNY